MHDHDLDLIAAFAEGSLEDVTEAARLVASCEQCRSELEAQRRALAFLQAAAPVVMSPAESHRLRRGAWSGLERPRRSWWTRPWWVPAGAVAATLLVVVGVAAFLRRGGASPTAFDTVAGALGAPTTTMAAAMAEMRAAPPLVTQLPGGTAEEVGARVRGLMTDAESDQGSTEFAFGAPEKADESLSCLDRVSGQRLVAAARTVIDGVEAIVFVVESEGGLAALIYESATCDPIDLPIPD
jgi:hypothetical protein